PDTRYSDHFGTDVALRDGIAVAGAPDADHLPGNVNFGGNVGAAYVFDFNIVVQPPNCNGNCRNDDDEVDAGLASDCNGNGIPDECDVASGLSTDCNGNHVLDECDLAAGFEDCDDDGVLDACAGLTRLGSSDQGTSDWLGHSVAIDGDLAVAGDPEHR